MEDDEEARTPGPQLSSISLDPRTTFCGTCGEGLWGRQRFDHPGNGNTAGPRRSGPFVPIPAGAYGVAARGA
jgi:hypothetical protein